MTKDTLENKNGDANKFNKSSLLKFIIIMAALIFFGGVVYGGIRFFRLKNIKNFSLCKAGDTLKLKNASLNIVGVENYQSKKLESKVCHLTLSQDDLIIDYYFDGQALVKLEGGKDKDTGNGCIVYQIKNVKNKNELCFGNKVKSYQDEEIKKEETKNEWVEEFKDILSSKPTPKISLAGTKWRYMIQVGGGVGGIIAFDKDENGSLSGTSKEFGPEGEKQKQVVGSYEKDNFLLTLEGFSTFKVVLSEDGKIMTGKPVEQNKDIFYPEDFFKAAKEE